MMTQLPPPPPPRPQPPWLNTEMKAILIAIGGVVIVIIGSAVASNSEGSQGAGGGTGLILLLPLIGLYCLPLIIGASRRVPNLGSLIVVNIFLGWTFVGWVVALAMAARSAPQR